jgi:hypothetical protein
MCKLVAGRGRVAGAVHGFDDHCVYALGAGIDEVLIHPGGDGQGTHDTVHIDLVLNGVLGIYIIGRLCPADIELPPPLSETRCKLVGAVGGTVSLLGCVVRVTGLLVDLLFDVS